MQSTINMLGLFEQQLYTLKIIKGYMIYCSSFAPEIFLVNNAWASG